MTQSPPRPTRPRDRRRTIQLAAARLFAENGFAATGLGEVAGQVGVTPAAIYRHFAGKDEMLETIVLDALTGMREAAELALEDAGLDPEERLTRVLGAMLELGRAQPDAVTIYIRERHLLGGKAAERRHEDEARVARAIGALVLELQPQVAPSDLDARLRAMNGVLASAVVQRHTVPPARLRSLYVRGLATVLLAPPHDLDPEAEAEAADALPPWQAPRTRREEILAAAGRLFRLYGYHGAGIDQIGEAAGIAGPTVYGTYPSKVDILVDAVDHAVATLEVLTDRALARAVSAESALRILAESYAEAIATNREIVAVAARDIRHLPDPDRQRIRRRQEDYRQRADAVLLQLRPELSEAEARTLFVGAYALAGQVVLARRPPSLAHTADLMVTFLLAGPSTA